MTMWRTISGQILGLDRAFFNEEVFQNFCAEERLLGRAQVLENENYTIELAVTGRRRRVALMDDEGTVIPGMPLAEIVDKMSTVFHKAQIDIGGEIRYGEIDLGGVDIDVDEDVEILQRINAEGRLSAVTPDAADDSEDDEEGPQPPVLYVSDIPLAEVPALAVKANAQLAVFPHSNTRAIVSSTAIDISKEVFPRPVFLLSLVTQGDDAPRLTVQIDNQKKVVWTWDGQPDIFDWMKDHETAVEFGDEYLGAGAVARTCVLDIEQASALDVRSALLSSPKHGPAFFIQALKLPHEVVDVLAGRLSVKDVPAAQVFESSSFRQTVRDIVALEISGQGVMTPKLWDIYRKFYLDHPGIMNAVASAQAAIGGTVFASSLKSGKSKKAKWGAGIGAVLMVNAVSRVLTTHWVQEALNRSESAKKLTYLTSQARSAQIKSEQGENE